MKRLPVWLMGAFYGLLTLSGINLPHHTTEADLKENKISSITQNTPLYLEHSSTISSTVAQWHGSHGSHGSQGQSGQK